MNKQEKIVLEDYEHGLECLWRGEYERATEIFEECKKQYFEIGNSVMYCRSLSSLGVTFEELGSRDMAMDCYLQALNYVKANGINYYVGVYYGSIGNCFLKLNDYESAVKYFKMGEEILLREKQDTLLYEKWLAICHLNIGAAYLHIGEYEKSEEYISKGYERAKKIGEEYYTDTLMTELCRVRCKRGDKKFFEEHYNELPKEFMPGSESLTDIFFTVRELSLLYEENKCYDDMLQILKSFENLINDIDPPRMRVKLYELYLKYYTLVKDSENYKKACVDYAKYCKILSEKERIEKIRAINVKISLEEARSSLASANSISERDGLTGLKNRYSLNEDVKRMIADCEAGNESLLMMIIDVDCFKIFNDTYGHVRGDEVLIEVSDIISGAIKDIGNGYRFGGDEFVILVKAPLKNVGDRIATELRTHLHHMNIKNEASNVRSELTISIGGFLAKRPWEFSFDDLLNKADEALYSVKESGRNDYKIKVQDDTE
ncbi:MAG: GGDEF domain-containing protein [Lachnospiraceae bacterium]|nr:GGDEF domain-containing protein [Lachnospiraceae bacterium]